MTVSILGSMLPSVTLSCYGKLAGAHSRPRAGEAMLLRVLISNTDGGTITKLPESGVLCGNITEFGVAEDHLSTARSGDSLSPYSFIYPYSNCKLKMTELIIKGIELGRITSKFFVYKCCDQLAPTRMNTSRHKVERAR